MDEAGGQKIVFHQRLITAIGTLLVGLAILGFTIWSLVKESGAGIGLGVITISIGARSILRSIRTLRDPGRLTISADGFTFHQAGWSRRWLWADVGPFTVHHDAVGPMALTFSVHGLAAVVDDLRRPSLPDIWNSSLHVICRELNDARARWGGRDIDEVAPAALTSYVG